MNSTKAKFIRIKQRKHHKDKIAINLSFSSFLFFIQHVLLQTSIINLKVKISQI